MAAICSSDDIARWFGQAGDPTLMAWVITFGYAAAALACHAAITRQDAYRGLRGNRWFWRMLMLGMIALGLNKQLDLQSLLIDCGRSLSREGGWFGYRRLAERGFAIVLAIMLAVGLALVGRRLRRPGPAMRFAAAGIVLLSGFILIRTGSILHMPGLGRATAGHVQNMMELCGVAAIAFGGYQAAARPSAG